MADFAVLCPGQGLQSPEMFDFAIGDAAGQATLQAFEESLGRDLRAAVRAGDALFDNAVAQPAIVAAAMSTWAVLAPRLADHGLVPALFAGYSVGEVSAWACAGAWDARQAAQVVRTRAQLMDAASPPGCGMLAVLGLQMAELVPLLAAVDGSPALHIAIVNDDDHVVLAGPAAALDHADLALRAQGASTRRLDVRLPSHTPLLATAAADFAAALMAHPAAPPTAPVLRGIDGRKLYRSEDAALALSRAVAAPIRWVDCMGEMAESGVTVALELSPSRSLTKLLAAAQPQISARSVVDFRSAAGVVAWLEKALLG